MILAFSKMHGLGNDFMVIDAINQRVELNSNLIQKWSNRNLGIGFDQLLLVEKTAIENAEFKYRIFNADGNEVEQCGNGARCFARFVTERGLTQSKIIPVETNTGLITLEMISSHEVRVDMGTPEFTPEKIPLNLSKQAIYSLQYQDQEIHFSSLSMGNPHAVIEVEDVDTAPVLELGRFIESHDLFPNKVNVAFMQIMDRSHMKVRVFERGVGETLACGSGVCAAMVAAKMLGKIDSQCKVDVRGGALNIEWQNLTDSVMMTGTTASVFEGQIEI